MTRIAAVHGRQIFDSRGRPTVEVEVHLQDGRHARASVPSGASTGSFEAHELRDGIAGEYGGLGVQRAVDAVNGDLADALSGRDPCDQSGIDTLLREVDGTEQLTRIGANAVLGASLAVCRLAAMTRDIPLYRYIGELAGQQPLLPMPMVNIFSGGLHAGRGMDVQDFLIIPSRAATMAEALQTVARIRDLATVVCREHGLPTLLADEGGLSPGCRTGEEALSLLVEVIDRAGLVPGDDVHIAIDVAAHSLVDARGDYVFAREGVTRTSEEVIEMVTGWVERFPVVSVEDALDEEDWAGWTRLTTQLRPRRTRLIGDDLFTTDAGRLARGITEGAGNGVLVKVNQNGTLTGTLEVVGAAREAGFAAIVSARSGETEDDFLADLAVGSGAGKIKVGSLRCSDRLTKYNQLLRIAEDTSLSMAAGPPARPVASVA